MIREVVPSRGVGTVWDFGIVEVVRTFGAGEPCDSGRYGDELYSEHVCVAVADRWLQAGLRRGGGRLLYLALRALLMVRTLRGDPARIQVIGAWTLRKVTSQCCTEQLSTRCEDAVTECSRLQPALLHAILSLTGANRPRGSEVSWTFNASSRSETLFRV